MPVWTLLDKSVFRSLAGCALIVVSFLNIWQSNRLAERIKPRDQDDVVVLERRLIGIRNALLEVKYRDSEIGYVYASVLNGGAMSEREDARLTQARYAMIPWIIRPNSLKAPYVILDISQGVREPAIPEGFVKLYDSQDGLMLLQRTQSQ